MDAEGKGLMQLISERTLRRIDRSVETGKIIPFLALATLTIAAIAGVVANFLSPDGFSSLGDALWWSAQTVTTVGYGDVVPNTWGGKVVGVFVMVFGVASVSLITALVTSSFITYQERRAGGELDRHQQLVDALERIDSRLTELEHRLS
jgi:voltage-gated potassium channel Kch